MKMKKFFVPGEGRERRPQIQYILKGRVDVQCVEYK